MADKTPMEDVFKRAFDANLRYWETLNRAASDYVETMTKVWKDAPISWTPGTSSSKNASASSTAASEPPFAAALLLEGPAGGQARAVVMVRNDLDRDAEAPVVPSLFTGPDGVTVDLGVQADPARVKVAPGSQVPVTLTVHVPASLADGASYRGEVNVPGLSDRGVPVVIRRRGTVAKAAAKAPTKATPKTAAKPATSDQAASKSEKTASKKATKKKATKKKAAKKKASK